MKAFIILTGVIFSALSFSSCSGESKAASAKYQCPMKCEGDKTYPDPGQCPVCGMDLKELK